MTKIEASAVINRPMEDIWKFMIDLANTPKWDPGVLEAKQTSAGPIGVGTTVQTRHPKDRVLNARVIEYVPGQKFTLEFTTGPVKGSKISYSIEEADGQKSTKLTRPFDIRFSGFYKLVGPFLVRGARRESGAEIGNVKRILES